MVDMRFLIADRNDEFTTWLGELIKENNDEYIGISDYSSLETVYKDYKPDVLLLNMYIGDIDSFRIAAEINKEFPSALIALVSGFNDKKLMAEAERIGAVFVIKENVFEFYTGLNAH